MIMYEVDSPMARRLAYWTWSSADLFERGVVLISKLGQEILAGVDEADCNAHKM